MTKWFVCRATQARRAEVSLYSDIGFFGITADDFRRELQNFGEVDVIDLRINSDGGAVADGLAIYNTLRRHPATVEVTVDGFAASIASIIAMAGSVVRMNRGAQMMIHDPSVGLVGNADAHEHIARVLREIGSDLAGIYAQRTRMPRDQIVDMMREETWMGAERAVSMGFADEILDAEPIAAQADFSRFRHPPEEVRRLVAVRGDAAHPANRERPMADQNTAPAADAQPDKTVVDSAVASVTGGDAPSIRETKAQKPGNWAAILEQEDIAAEPADASTEELQRRAEALAQQKFQAEQRKMRAAYDAARKLSLDTSIVDQLLEKECPLEDIPTALIQVRNRRDRSQNAQARLSLVGARVAMGFSHDDPKVVRDRMADAIAARFVPGGEVPDASRKYVNWGPQDMMRDLLERQGHATVGKTRSEIVDAALHTTSDFPELLSTSANKIFLGSYQAAPQTFRAIAARRDFANFQAHNMLRDGDYPTLKQVLEDGEFTRGTISESRETGTLKTYGRTFGITRHTLVNDTLGAFGQMAAKIGQAVARFENKTVWAIITSNPTLNQTAAAMFSATHKNLDSDGAGGGGTALAISAMGSGRALMRKQTSLDGEILNIAPQVLVVPAALETTAEQILNQTAVVTDPAKATPASFTRMQVVTEALLDANSATAWYLFADPMGVGANVAYGYLEGEGAPRVRTNDPFNVDGIEFQVRLDFHATAIDYRFGYKDQGSV